MTGYDSWFDGRQTPASDAVSSRRNAMQTQLLGAVRGRRRRRQAIRATVGAGLIAAAAWLGFNLTSTDAPAPVERPTAKAALRMEHSEFAIVQRSSTAPSGWVVQSQPMRGEWLVGEDQAVDLLRESGVRAGFMRVRGELSLTGSLEEPTTED